MVGTIANAAHVAGVAALGPQLLDGEERERDRQQPETTSPEAPAAVTPRSSGTATIWRRPAATAAPRSGSSERAPRPSSPVCAG